VRWKAATVSIVLVVLLVAPAAAIDIKPQPIPGMEDKVNMLLGWLYWAAIIVCVAVIIAGLALMKYGGRDTRMWIVEGLVALVALLALPQILGALGI